MSPDDLDRIQYSGERDYATGNLERNSIRLREVQSALRRKRQVRLGSASSAERTSIRSGLP
jgi:hypothetical protein